MTDDTATTARPLFDPGAPYPRCGWGEGHRAPRTAFDADSRENGGVQGYCREHFAEYDRGLRCWRVQLFEPIMATIVVESVVSPGIALRRALRQCGIERVSRVRSLVEQMDLPAQTQLL